MVVGLWPVGRHGPMVPLGSIGFSPSGQLLVGILA